MGVPLPIIIMIAMRMLMFGVSVIVLLKKKGSLISISFHASLKQLVCLEKPLLIDCKGFS